ncbi:MULTISPECIES: FliM/FliN family flagellar motor switch protein [unclassified Sinorhizobium]|uniref:FliM/FliN family flagellar motor switch protein n=1 Tax=unclassified Sinorhizobium TaxID=2613772 RepID=UPI0024C4435C|nr:MULTISPECIES: FliM/FliN family flagellar motor switch protein [unclassified Sinorhizobium]MDK1377992.1 FliM/FliN family flagellar motor switch protein [Sinorhizobium sp. 6-70]MDK1480556.1 FliM/FliN family flagellar motor switch protein [Sinorhizobium sp. 6-117]
MNPSTASNVYAFDKRLLARMIGALGDDKTIGRTALELGQVFGELLPGIYKAETGHDIAIGYAGFKTGLRNELIAGLGDGVLLTEASLRNWCQDFQIGCDSPVLITLVEALLGAEPTNIGEPEPRSMSQIEIDVAVPIFEKIADVLRLAVNAPGGFEPVVGRPYNSETHPKPDPTMEDVYAASINMTVGLGPVLSTFSVIVPQSVLLKTQIVPPRGADQADKGKTEWTEQIEEQVRRSAVTLEARIRLESLTLDTISRLQPGDVIPFHDGQDVRVDVNANGRELYVCEFGRSGAKYTVRVKDTHGSEQDILRHIMS